MHLYVLPMDFIDHVDEVTPVTLPPLICRFGLRVNLAKVLVMRPAIYTNSTNRYKPVAQVNCDSLLKMLTVRGIAATCFTVEPSTALDSFSMILRYENAIVDNVRRCREDTLLIVPFVYSGKRPNLFGRLPETEYTQLTKAGWEITYLTQGDL